MIRTARHTVVVMVKKKGSKRPAAEAVLEEEEQRPTPGGPVLEAEEDEPVEMVASMCDTTEYVAKASESLRNIAAAFGVEVEELVALNADRSAQLHVTSRLKAGAKLLVPAAQSAGAAAGASASGAGGSPAAAAAPLTVAGASATQAPVQRGLSYMDLETRTTYMEWIIGLRPGSHIENVEGFGACCIFALAAAVWPSVLEHGETVLVGTVTSSRTPKATMTDRCVERFMRDAAVNAALRCHHEETTGAVVYVRVAPRTLAYVRVAPRVVSIAFCNPYFSSP